MQQKPMTILYCGMSCNYLATGAPDESVFFGCFFKKQNLVTIKTCTQSSLTE